MVDNDLSRAVVPYTAHGSKPSPRTDAAAVVAEFGQVRGPELVMRVESVLAEAAGIQVEWAGKTLGQAGDVARALTAERHPELSGAALEAIRWSWTFDWL